MEFKCHHCGYTARIPERYVGKTVNCPKCKASVQIAAPKPEKVTTPEVAKKDAAKLRPASKDKAETAQIFCPKCGAPQPKSKACMKCGVVFDSYFGADSVTDETPDGGTTVRKPGTLEFVRGVVKPFTDKFNDLSRNIKILTMLMCPAALGTAAYLVVFNIQAGIERELARQRTAEGFKRYSADFNDAFMNIHLAFLLCVRVCDGYSYTWKNAIESRHKDFNLELMMVRSKLKEQGVFEKLEGMKQDIEVVMKKLNNPPKEFSKAHEKLIDLYGTYSQIHSQAMSPSGSLMSFNQAINSLQANFVRVRDEIMILKPELKVSVENQGQKD